MSHMSIHHKVHLVLMLGDAGLNVVAISEDEIVDSFFITLDNIDNNEILQQFIQNIQKKFAIYKVMLLIASKKIYIHHEEVPFLSNLGVADPVDHFCRMHFIHDEYYWHQVYETLNSDSEIWKTVILTHPNTVEIKNIFELCRRTKLVIDAAYFLPSMISSVIKFISTKCMFSIPRYTVVNFVTICEVTGIYVNITHGSDILYYSLAEYPHGKSDEYVQGTIEQMLNDSWIKLNGYIKATQANRLTIILVSSQLYELLRKSSYHELCDTNSSVTDSVSPKELMRYDDNIGAIRVVSYSDVTDKHYISNFADELLVSLVYKTQIAPIQNMKLNIYYFYSRMINILHKSRRVAIIFLVIICSLILYNVGDLLYENKNLSSKIRNSEQQINMLQSKFKDVNIRHLADIYDIEKVLYKNSTQATFSVFKFLAAIIVEFDKPDINIHEITFSSNTDFLASNAISVEMNFRKNNLDPIKFLNNAVDNIKKIYPDVEIKIQRSAYHLGSSSTRDMKIKIIFIRH